MILDKMDENLYICCGQDWWNCSKELKIKDVACCRRPPIPLDSRNDFFICQSKGETILTQVRLWRTSIQVSSPFRGIGGCSKTTTTERSELVATFEKTLKSTTICNNFEAREAMDEPLKASGILISSPCDNKPQDGALKTKNSLICVKKANKLERRSRTVAVFGQYQNGGIVTEDQGFNTTAGLAVPIGQQLMCMSFHNMLFLKPLP